MKWIGTLKSDLLATMTVEERGKLLTGIVCLMENIPFDPVILQGTAAYAFGLLEKAKQKEESKAAKCAEAGRKGGGNPALKATATRSEPEAKLAHTEPEKQARKTSNKISSKDVESEIVAFTQNEKLRETIRAFVDYRKESGHALTVHAFKLMLGKLEGLSSSDEDRIDILNNSIVCGYQGIFKPNRNSGKTYGPNGVKILPESEQLHDLDHLF